MKIMKHLLAVILITFSLFAPSITLAKPYYGANFSLTLIAKEPPALHGYQFMFNYDPQRFQWRQFNIYFDGGFSHFWITNTPYHTAINIYSLAPVIRYTFKKRGPFSPYLEFSFGIAYLNHTYLDSRNLGIHFAFQDRAGIGILLGTAEQFSIGLQAVHYSNAHLSSHNSGISIPVLLEIGYRFS
ncbi:MAG: acyloxyacyl hydrolase [Gammaproteobacteria bacterium]|nr:acyloxyacyl hydrolase [Gammaproteobacteria bacterium]